MKNPFRRDFLAAFFSVLVFGTGSGYFLNSLPPEPPLIGIPQTRDSDYAAAVRKAGGIPVPLSYDNEKIPEHIENLDGVLFPGGRDVPPQVYGEEPHPTVKVVSEERFRFESELARAWIDQTDKPFLGVCLGCQMLNVVRGGSLVQDIPSEFGSNHRKDHSVKIEESSKLFSIFGKTNLEVNSRHHQAVKKTGNGIRVVARAPDGVVEGIELEGERFVVGVQWHPESMHGDVLQERLYSEFVRRAVSKKKPAPWFGFFK